MEVDLQEQCLEDLKQVEVNEDSTETGVNSLYGVLLQCSHPEDGRQHCTEREFAKKKDALTALAKIVPEEKFLKDMLEYIESGIRDENPETRKTACVLMAALASTREDHCINEYWRPFLPYLLEVLQDLNPLVQNADDAGFIDAIQPVLLNCLKRLCNTWQSENDVKVPINFGDFLVCVGKMCGKGLALQEACFIQVFDFLLSVVTDPYPLDVRELFLVKALKIAVRQTDINGKVRIALRFQEPLHTFNESNIGEEGLAIQYLLLEELKLLEMDLSCRDQQKCFEPLAKDCVRLVTNIIDVIDEEEELETIYQFLHSLHEYEEVKTDVETVVAQSVECNLEILRADDEMSCEDSDDGLDEEDSDSDDSDVDDISLEKEKACLHIKCLAEHTKLESFEDFFSMCVERLLETVGHPRGCVRGAAMQALARICYVVSGEDRLDVLKVMVPDFVEAILQDSDCYVVISALNAIGYLFANRYGVGECNELITEIVYALSQVLLSKIRSRGEDDDDINRIIDDINSDTRTFGYRSYSCCVGIIIPNMIEEMEPEMVAKSFRTLFPILISKTDPHCSVVNRKMAIWVLGRAVKRLGEDGGTFIEELIPVLVRFCSSDDREVRETAFSALQNCVVSCRKAVFPYYSEILSVQRKCLLKDKDANLTTACITVAGMIVNTGGSMIAGLNDVLPAIFQNLMPLSNYRHEGLRVTIQCLNLLYKVGHSVMKERVSLVLDFIVSIVSNKTYYGLARDEATVLLASLKTDFLEEYRMATENLSEELKAELENRLSSLIRHN